MDNLEKNMIIQGIVSGPIEEEDKTNQMVSPTNLSKDMTPINPTFQKSRVSKTPKGLILQMQGINM